MTTVAGQALVTDPGGAVGGGYTLVASSPAVPSSDADFLARTSQVTDFLHLEERPGPFLSFYDLPSGARAFTRRFVHGKRRGDYNRVVAHSLVVPEDVLQAVAWDPWQLLGKNRFRFSQSGEPVSFPALGMALAEDTPSALDDLELDSPADPIADVLASLERRRSFLTEAWGERRFRERLGWVLETLRAGNRPLLPQEKEEEQILALAWLLLPVVDRKRVRWTTHLAVSAEDLFQLANGPSGRNLVDEEPGGWRAVPSSPSAVDPSPPVAAVLAAVLREDEDVPPRALLRCLLETRHSLLEGGADLRRQISGLGMLEYLPEEGHPTVAALHFALRKLAVRTGEEVEESGLPEAMVVRCAAATARNAVLTGDQETTPTLREVQRLIEERLRLPGVLEPGVALQLARGRSDPAILPWAVALVIDRLPAPPKGVAEREALTDVLLERSRPAPEIDRSEPHGETRQEELQLELLARLTAELLLCRSGKALEALSTLARLSGGILRVRDFLRDSEDLEGLLALVEFARREGQEETAVVMVRDDLVPLFAGYEGLPSAVRPGQLRHALGAARAAPKVLGAALRRWHGDLFDLAVDELREWPGEPASEAAAAMVGAGGGPLPSLPERRSLVGTAGHLAKRGVPVTGWLPFALAEAAFLDRQGAPPERDEMGAFLEDHPLQDAASARAVLAAAARPEVPARGCHRALVRAAVPGLPGASVEVVRDLTAVLESAPAPELVAWGGVVTSAAGRIEGSAGANLRWRWWNLYAERMDEASVPPAAVEIFDAMTPREKLRAVREALARLPSLEEGPEERELVESFRRAAAEDRRLGADLEVILVRREVRRCRLDLDLGVARTYELTWQEGERFRRALLDLLPSVPVERAVDLLALVRSPRIWPGARIVMTVAGNGRKPSPEALETSLEMSGAAALDRLPVFDELAEDGLLLLTVARFVGGRWEDRPRVAERLLVDSLESQRADYAAAFLNRAESTAPKRGYLYRLGENRSLTLLRRLRQALDSPWGGDLARHAYRIRSNLTKANQPIRRKWRS